MTITNGGAGQTGATHIARHQLAESLHEDAEVLNIFIEGESEVILDGAALLLVAARASAANDHSPAPAGEFDPASSVMLDNAGEDAARELTAWFAVAGTSMARARIASDLLSQTPEGNVIAARSYFRAELRDSTVQTVIGSVNIIGGTWQEMRKGLASDGLKAALNRHIPEILRRGYLDGGRQRSTKPRFDYAAFYFIRLNGIEVGGQLVDAGVTAGEPFSSACEYAMDAYSLGHSEMRTWQKRTADTAIPRSKLGTVAAAGEGDQPALDAILPQSESEFNLTIIAVRDAAAPKPILDAVGTCLPCTRPDDWHPLSPLNMKLWIPRGRALRA